MPDRSEGLLRVAEVGLREAREARAEVVSLRGKQPEIDYELVAALVDAAVAKAIAALELPEGPPGPEGQPGERGAPGERGERGISGVGLSGAVVDRNGALIVTLSDGTVTHLGPVVGRDGTDGLPGTKGADGRDGFGFEHMSVTVEDGGRWLVPKFQRGDEVKEFRLKLNTMLDRGVWREGEYLAGDAVTWGGSVFVAQRDTTTKPETPGSDWRLSVKRGRDGKDGRDGKNGERGMQGPDGRPGRDGYTPGPAQ